MSAHTPGPWTLDTVTTSCGICHKVGPFPWKEGKENHACIYVDYPGNGKIEGELLANARLIAAAPDLLTASKEALSSMESIWRTAGHDDDWIYDEMGSELSAGYFSLRAAIAKATGEKACDR